MGRTAEEMEARDLRMLEIYKARAEYQRKREAANIHSFSSSNIWLAFDPDNPKSLFKTPEDIQNFCHMSEAPEVVKARLRDPEWRRQEIPCLPPLLPDEVSYIRCDKSAAQWVEFCGGEFKGIGIGLGRYDDAFVQLLHTRRDKLFPILLWDRGPITTAEQLRDLAGLEQVPGWRKHAGCGLREGDDKDRISSVKYCYVDFEALRRLAARVELKTVRSGIPCERRARVAVRMLEADEMTMKPMEGYFDFEKISTPLHPESWELPHHQRPSGEIWDTFFEKFPLFRRYLPPTPPRQRPSGDAWDRFFEKFPDA